MMERSDSPQLPPGASDASDAHVKRIIMEHMINNPPPRVSTPYTPPDTPDRGINPERDNYNVDKIVEVNFQSRYTIKISIKK